MIGFALGLIGGISIFTIALIAYLYYCIQDLNKTTKDNQKQFEAFRQQVSQAILGLDDALRKVEGQVAAGSLLNYLSGKDPYAGMNPAPTQKPQNNNRFDFRLVDLDKARLEKSDKKDSETE